MYSFSHYWNKCWCQIWKALGIYKLIKGKEWESIIHKTNTWILNKTNLQDKLQTDYYISNKGGQVQQTSISHNQFKSRTNAGQWGTLSYASFPDDSRPLAAWTGEESVSLLLLELAVGRCLWPLGVGSSISSSLSSAGKHMIHNQAHMQIYSTKCKPAKKTALTLNFLVSVVKLVNPKICSCQYWTENGWMSLWKIKG